MTGVQTCALPISSIGCSMRCSTNSESHRDHGQATVELALCLPVVCMFLLAVVQVGVVVRNRLAVDYAARVGARAAAVSTSGSAASDAAAAAVRLHPLDVKAIEADICNTPPRLISA